MNGIIVGKYNGVYLIYTGQQFVILAAPTRSGKGVAIVIPNLLNFADSAVVLDVKLENYRYTSKFREMHGQKVFLFAPFSKDCMTHRWNVLDTVNRDRNFRVGDVMAIGQILWPSDCDPKEKFWNDNARNLFVGIVLYLMETPDLPCTMGEVLRQGSGKGKAIKDHIQDIVTQRSAGPNALSDECLDALNRFLASPENTLGNISSTFNAPMLIFANPIVDAATSASDFDINDVRRQRMTIYFGVQPNRLADASLLVNLFFSQLINKNIEELPENNPELKYQCLLVLDEFTAIGKVGIIAKANSFIAGYNLRLLTIIQSIAQLESVYGEKDTRTLVTNHGLHIVYPPREQKDANEVSETLGYFTEKAKSTSVNRPRAWGNGGAGSTGENTSDQRRALMLPQELKEMGKENEIVLPDNCKAIFCQKARFFDDHAFLDRLKKVSPYLRALDDTKFRRFAKAKLGLTLKAVPTEKQLKHAAFVLQELSSPVPRLDIDAYRAKVEGRTRTMAAGEGIDLAKLAIDGDDLPPLDNPENPSPAAVEQLVDAFFSKLEWADSNTGEIVGPPPAAGDNVEGGEIAEGVDWEMSAGGEIEAVPSAMFNDFDQALADSHEMWPATEAAGRTAGVIDLAVLDD